MEEQLLFEIEWFQAGQETWARPLPQVEQSRTRTQPADNDVSNGFDNAYI